MVAAIETATTRCIRPGQTPRREPPARVPHPCQNKPPSVTQPLQTGDEHKIIRGINQKRDQAFVMLAEM